MATILADSEELVLRYVGEPFERLAEDVEGRQYTTTIHPQAAGTPARDLTQADIARLAYRRAYASVAKSVGELVDPEDPDLGVITRPDPRHPDPELVDVITDELLRSGLYVAAAASGKPAKKAETPAPATTEDQAPAPAGDTAPAAPAEQPEA